MAWLYEMWLHCFWLWDKVNKNYKNKIQFILLFIFCFKKIRLHTYKKFYRWILLFFYFDHSSLFLFYLKHSSLFLHTQSIILITPSNWWMVVFHWLFHSFMYRVYIEGNHHSKNGKKMIQGMNDIRKEQLIS